jgi:CheY-like chemotaxis protein
MQSFDFEIVDAHDGEEAIEIYNKTKDYDIIFMDIMMPNMGGETALRNLKLDPTFKTPVIALTADAVEGSSEKYISEGFKDYLAKPFSKEDIIDVINKLF